MGVCRGSNLRLVSDLNVDLHSARAYSLVSEELGEIMHDELTFRRGKESVEYR